MIYIKVWLDAVSLYIIITKATWINISDQTLNCKGTSTDHFDWGKATSPDYFVRLSCLARDLLSLNKNSIKIPS